MIILAIVTETLTLDDILFFSSTERNRGGFRTGIRSDSQFSISFSIFCIDRESEKNFLGYLFCSKTEFDQPFFRQKKSPNSKHLTPGTHGTAPFVWPSSFQKINLFFEYYGQTLNSGIIKDILKFIFSQKSFSFNYWKCGNLALFWNHVFYLMAKLSVHNLKNYSTFRK